MFTPERMHQINVLVFESEVENVARAIVKLGVLHLVRLEEEEPWIDSLKDYDTSSAQGRVLDLKSRVLNIMNILKIGELPLKEVEDGDFGLSREDFDRMEKDISSLEETLEELLARKREKFPVSLSGSLLKDEKGEVIGTLGIFRDITEEKKLQAQLLQSEKLASIGQLTAGVAHEILNPLNIISGRIQLLQMEEDIDPDLAKSLKIMNEQVDRTARIVDNLLHFSRTYSPERVNPGDDEHSITRMVKVVAGMDEETTAVMAELYGLIAPAIFRARDIKTAEAAKVIENTQRDLNIALMNELSLIFDRLGVDTRAVLEAAAEHIKEGGRVSPEIMIPQVCTLEELKWVHRYVTKINREVEKKYSIEVPYKFGTMVEVVRACMRAGRIAELAEFISFGTNDLTQATFSFSREDAENKFLPLYQERGILEHNPFDVLDIKGVGRLMRITMEWARKTKPDLKVGICGDISHSRVTRSNIWGLKKLGAEVVVIGPSTLIPPEITSLGVKVCYDHDAVLGELDVRVERLFDPVVGVARTVELAACRDVVA